jgi:phage gpG-like protein
MQLQPEFDDRKFREGMAETARQLPGSIYQAVVNACSLVETRAKTHHLSGATLTPRGHYLQRSVKSTVNRIGTTVTGRVGSPEAYAAIHEYGGIIRPKNAKFLVFQINGRWIRTTKVTIPKRQWLSKSVEDVTGQIETVFGREVEIAIG